MKKTILALLASLALAAGAHAHAGVELGPNGGRLVEFGEKEGVYMEIVLKDGKFVMSLFDGAKKEIPASGQILTVIHKEKNAKIAPELNNGKWSIAKPEGDNFWLVMSLKADAKAKAKVGRLHYDGTICSECKAPEWICKCSESKEKK